MVNGYDVTGYVIDLMLKDEYIIHFQSRINLNDYFIIPYTEMSPNDGDYSLISRDEYNFRLLLSRNNGLVIPKGSLADAKLETQRISDIYDLPYTLSVSYDEEMALYNNILLICYPLMIYIVVYIKKIKYRKNNSQNIE